MQATRIVAIRHGETAWNVDGRIQGHLDIALNDAGREQARILIHAINYAPEFIGCGKYTTELAEFLVARGHRVEVVTAPPHYPGWYVRETYSGGRYAAETRNGVRVTRCPMLMKRGGRGLWRILAPLTFALTGAPALAWRVRQTRSSKPISRCPVSTSSVGSP